MQNLKLGQKGVLSFSLSLSLIAQEETISPVKMALPSL